MQLPHKKSDFQNISHSVIPTLEMPKQDTTAHCTVTVICWRCIVCFALNCELSVSLTKVTNFQFIPLDHQLIATGTPMWCECSITFNLKSYLSWSSGWGPARPHWCPLAWPHWPGGAWARRAWWVSHWGNRWRGSCQSSVAGLPVGCCRWLPGARWGCWGPSYHTRTGTGTSCIWKKQCICTLAGSFTLHI